MKPPQLTEEPQTSLSLQIPQYASVPAPHMLHRGTKPSAYPSSEEDDSESEIENFTSPCKKKPSLYWPKPSEDTDFQNPVLVSRNATSQSKGKRLNNVWGSVITEQSLSAVVSGVSTKKVESFRDVESYDYTRAQLDKRLEEEEDAESKTDDEHKAEVEKEKDLVDIETFGMDTVKPRVRKIKDRLGRRAVDESEGADGYSSDDKSSSDQSDTSTANQHRRHNTKDRMSSNSQSSSNKSIKERLGCRNQDRQEERYGRKRPYMSKEKQYQQIKERLGVRSYDASKERSHIKADMMDPVEVVVEEIMRVLGEPAEQTQLFSELFILHSLL